MKNTKKIVFIVLAAVLALVLAFASSYTIGSGTVGIVSTFGEMKEDVKEPGLHFKMPIISTVKRVDVKVQSTSGTTEAATADLQAMDVTYTITYHIEKDKAVYLYKTVGSNYFETLIMPLANQSLKSATVNYNAEEIHKAREMVSQDVKDKMSAKLSEYGISIDEVSLINFELSREYMAAIEQKQIAAQAVETAKNELEKAKVEAETKLVQAQAEAQANEILEKSLSKEILLQMYIEKWNGVMPAVAGSNGTILDISSLLH